MTEDIATIRWNGVTFNLSRDADKDWHLTWTRGGDESHSCGQDAAEIIADACVAAGLDQETKWEILFALMSALRERIFN